MSKSNIVEACESIIKPLAPLALRTSAHLLIGVVRIHDGKQKSLMHDCSDALVKIKLAFRPGNVDLPSDRVTANIGSITMAETLDGNFDDEFPGVGDESMLDETQFNIGTMEEITMVEPDYHATDVAAPQMDGFGDEHNLEIEQGRDGDAPQQYMPTDLTLDDTNNNNDTTMGGNSTIDMLPDEIPVDDLQMADDFNQPLMADDFGVVEEVALDTTDINIEAVGDGNLDITDKPTTKETQQEDEEDVDAANKDKAQEDQPEEPAADDTLGLYNASRMEMLDVSEIQPINDDANTSSGPSVKLARRKRKLVVDEKAVEIASSEIKRGLAPNGPDDISKQPFRKTRSVFLFQRASHSMKGVQSRLTDRSPEAMFKRPLTGVWSGKLMDMYQQSLDYSRDDVPSTATEEDEQTKNVEEIEVGRNLDPEPIVDDIDQHINLDDTIDQHNQQQEQQQKGQLVDEEPPIDDVIQPVDETIPFDDVDQTLNNDVSAIGMDSRVDDFSIMDDTTNTIVDPAFDDIVQQQQVTSEEFENQDHLTKRTARMMTNLRTGFESTEELSFESMTNKKTKRVAAACLFELLVLKTKDYIHIDQAEPYCDITVTPTAQLLIEA